MLVHCPGALLPGGEATRNLYPRSGGTSRTAKCLEPLCRESCKLRAKLLRHILYSDEGPSKLYRIGFPDGMGK